MMVKMVKPLESDKEEWTVPNLEQTIEKLAKNSFQYASAGDVKRLVDEIMRLRQVINKP